MRFSFTRTVTIDLFFLPKSQKKLKLSDIIKNGRKLSKFKVHNILNMKKRKIRNVFECKRPTVHTPWF